MCALVFHDIIAGKHANSVFRTVTIIAGFYVHASIDCSIRVYYIVIYTCLSILILYKIQLMVHSGQILCGVCMFITKFVV